MQRDPQVGDATTSQAGLHDTLNIISIESFDDSTLNKIFSSLVDWHFSRGFEAIFTRLGKVGPALGIMERDA